METAYCFHLIAAGCWDADGAEIAISHCPSSSLSAVGCSADSVRRDLFDSCHLKRLMRRRLCNENEWWLGWVGNLPIDDPPGVWGLEGIGKLFMCGFDDDVGVFWPGSRLSRLRFPWFCPPLLPTRNVLLIHDSRLDIFINLHVLTSVLDVCIRLLLYRQLLTFKRT